MSISGFAITSTNVKPIGLVSAFGSVLRSVAQCLSASVYSRALASVSISALNYISASVSASTTAIMSAKGLTSATQKHQSVCCQVSALMGIKALIKTRSDTLKRREKMNTWRKMDNLVAETLHESLTAAKG